MRARLPRLLATATLALLAGCHAQPPLPLGGPLPDLARAEGWVGGERPKYESGRVVVVQAWAHWCGPCRQEAPELVKLHQEFRQDGVQFVGLTPDGSAALDDISRAMAELHMDWPTGYGAKSLLMSIPVQGLPTVLVYDRRGKLAWRSDQGGGTIEAAIRSALAS